MNADPITKGSEDDSSEKNFLLLEVESIAVFKSAANCQRVVPKIFDYVQKETKLKQEEIITKFRTLEPHEVGSKGKTMG